MINEAERLELLKVARASVAARVNGTPALTRLPEVEPTRRAGAFVTLHLNAALRGCIGHIEPDQPLAQVVSACAAAACSSDPRFPPVTPGELPQLDIELSVLGPLEPITSLDDVEVGRHGLLVELGARRGLLLPQVAVEHGWTRQIFVEQTCHKAGLSNDAWRNGATLWKFEAEVFAEK